MVSAYYPTPSLPIQHRCRRFRLLVRISHLTLPVTRAVENKDYQDQQRYQPATRGTALMFCASSSSTTQQATGMEALAQKL